MVFQPTEMIFYGWTFAALMMFVRVTSHVQLNNESYVTFLSENGKNNAKYFSWGLFDTTATVGMVFHYNISAVLPRGEDVNYVVSEVGSNNYKLPNWLQFDDVTGCLIGVPNARDGTKIFYLKVFLIDNHNSRVDVEDVFSIKVNEQTPFYAGSSARSLQSHETTSVIVKCLPGSTVTTTTVLIDADFKVLLPSDMVRMIQNLCKHLGLSLTATRLVSPATIHYLDNTVLVAGPGDVKVPLHTGAWFQWEVGCGNVYSYHMGILQKLEIASQNGDLSLSIGFGIIGWYVTNVKTLHTNVYRLKRQAPMMLTTPTIIQTIGPPAAKAVPTATVSESKSADDPQTRVVLSQTSPVYSTIEATDLHNAYIKSSGRHHIRTRSKTAMHKLAKTSFYVTPSVTPVRKVIPTEFSYAANGKFVNPKSSFISDGDLEPSVIMPQATNTAPTAILETRMNIVTDYSSVRQRSKVVQPSHSVSTSRVPAKVFTGNFDFQTSRQWLDDTGPRVNAELGTLSSTVRKVFMYKIPDHLFSDSIDGNTNNLKLQFSMPDGYDTSIVPWVKFNEASHMLFGFPLNISNRQYFLSATNSRGKSSRVGFYINVRERSKDQRVHFEMSITLEADFEIFINNVSALVDIATKISSAFGDKQPSELLVTSINQGSVEYNWTNSSLSADHPCQIENILTLAEYFIMPNCSLNGHFLETLKPFIIKKAAIVPKLSCYFEARAAVIPLSISSPSYRIVPQVETESAEADVIVSIIVPIVISVAVVILVIIIVCVLYRKWHKADRTGRKNVKKGTPVIFTAELEDKLIASNKPLIMDNERPPHPPNYQQASVIGNFPSTPHSKCYEPLISANQNCSIAGIPTQSSTIKSQQRCVGLQTSYRNPPPYDAR